MRMVCQPAVRPAAHEHARCDPSGRANRRASPGRAGTRVLVCLRSPRGPGRHRGVRAKPDWRSTAWRTSTRTGLGRVRGPDGIVCRLRRFFPPPGGSIPAPIVSRHSADPRAGRAPGLPQHADDRTGPCAASRRTHARSALAAKQAPGL